jgi:FRG domain
MSLSVFRSRRTLSSWAELAEALDYLVERGWVFRGQARADWGLETTLEREFPAPRKDVERQTLEHFMRRAAPLLGGHLVPPDYDAANWLGLIQHWGGATRLLDMTMSPYVALYFSFEVPGDSDRALWAIDPRWCTSECARIMSTKEGISTDDAFGRLADEQAQLVFSLVHGRPFPTPSFASFQPFAGVFPLEPWKPDSRQSAQQASFLCAADVEEPFIENVSWHSMPADRDVLFQLVLPASLRQEIIGRLSTMNVTAASLFPDLSGLARSLRTRMIRRAATTGALPSSLGWERT